MTWGVARPGLAAVARRRLNEGLARVWIAGAADERIAMTVLPAGACACEERHGGVVLGFCRAEQAATTAGQTPTAA